MEARALAGGARECNRSIILPGTGRGTIHRRVNGGGGGVQADRPPPSAFGCHLPVPGRITSASNLRAAASSSRIWATSVVDVVELLLLADVGVERDFDRAGRKNRRRSRTDAPRAAPAAARRSGGCRGWRRRDARCRHRASPAPHRCRIWAAGNRPARGSRSDSRARARARRRAGPRPRSRKARLSRCVAVAGVAGDQRLADSARRYALAVEQHLRHGLGDDAMLRAERLAAARHRRCGPCRR